MELVKPVEPVAVAPPRTRAFPWRQVGLLLGVVAGGVTLLEILRTSGWPQFRVFFLVAGGILIEAFPFILIGAVVAGAMEAFVPDRVFTRIGGLPRAVQVPVAGVAGFAMPLCDCATIPVTRRLLRKGVAPQAAITFMLAAPIVNPVVILSTAFAYKARGLMVPMVLGRLGLGLVVAAAVGWVLGHRSRDELLRSSSDVHEHHDGHSDPGHDASDICEDGCCSTGAERSRPRVFFGSVAGEFAVLGKYLVLGAAVAGLMKAFVPQSVLATVAEVPILNMLALMGLAAMLSLCSSSDAFVAASFTQFGPASQLAFLVSGPMFDAKLGMLYKASFSKGFVRTLVISVFAFTVVGTVWMEVLIG